jgi:small subunit ribosomal protein S18
VSFLLSRSGRIDFLLVSYCQSHYHMRFINRRLRNKLAQNTPVIAIVHKKSRSKLPAFQGTIDYKNIVLLRKFITAEGKILPRRSNQLTAKQQRYMAKAIKNARIIGLLPFINKNQPSNIQ